MFLRNSLQTHNSLAFGKNRNKNKIETPQNQSTPQNQPTGKMSRREYDQKMRAELNKDDANNIRQNVQSELETKSPSEKAKILQRTKILQKEAKGLLKEDTNSKTTDKRREEIDARLEEIELEMRTMFNIPEGE